MFTAILPDRPISAASQNEFVRPAETNVAVERVAPPNPVQPASTNLDQPKYQQRPMAEVSGSGTTFTAAILAGALPPRPETLNELYARIGASSIPEDLQSRLRDLQV